MLVLFLLAIPWCALDAAGLPHRKDYAKSVATMKYDFISLATPRYCIF